VADARIVVEVDTGIQQDGQSSVIEPAAAVELASPLRLDQFADELAGLVHLEVAAVVLSTTGDTLIASAEAPVAMWTDAEGISADALLDAAVAHTPDPTWHSDAPPGGISPEELRDKAVGGAMLSTDEMQLSVRYLLQAVFPA